MSYIKVNFNSFVLSFDVVILFTHSSSNVFISLVERGKQRNPHYICWSDITKLHQFEGESQLIPHFILGDFKPYFLKQIFGSFLLIIQFEIFINFRGSNCCFHYFFCQKNCITSTILNRKVWNHKYLIVVRLQGHSEKALPLLHSITTLLSTLAVSEFLFYTMYSSYNVQLVIT